MRTTETTMKKEIEKYLNHGFSLQGAIKQVKCLTLGRHDAAIDRAAKLIK